MRLATRTSVLVLVVALTVTGCAGGDEYHARSRPGSGSAADAAGQLDVIDLPADGAEPASSLEPFDSCDELLDEIRGEAAARVGPWGLEEGGLLLGRAEAAMEAPAAGDVAADAMAPPATTAAPATAPATSDTNVQELGVDEPDQVDVRSDRIVVLRGGTLHVIDPGGGVPQLVGSLELPEAAWGGQLLVQGERALVLGHGGGVVSGDAVPAGTVEVADDIAVAGRSTLSSVDLTDPAAPRLESSLEVDGEIVSARAVEGTARVVVRARSTGPEWSQPDEGDEEALEQARRANEEKAATADLADWLPQYELRSGDRRSSGVLGNCEQVHRPAAGFSGFGTLSVLTVPLDAPVAEPEVVSVLAGADVVYASASRLYVATTTWPEPVPAPAPAPPPDAPFSTSIHVFGIDAPGAAVHLGSGEVPGHLLNQYAMSEHEGLLRVAATEGAPWGTGTDSSVTVLQLQGDRLEAVGRVTGLGKPGERIHGVRFIGDTGYVVTFRETDPLYVVDLAEPAAPAVTGELEIPGYSAYLHPVGEGRLLGIGQAADEEGRTQGTQISLFDVSDPTDPRRTAVTTVADSWSAAEHDPHAVLWWEPASLLVVPIETWGPSGRARDAFLGALATRVDDAGLVEVGRLRHQTTDPWQGTIQRSFVVGDVLFTLSEQALATHRIADLAPIAQLEVL